MVSVLCAATLTVFAIMVAGAYFEYDEVAKPCHWLVISTGDGDM